MCHVQCLLLIGQKVLEGEVMGGRLRNSSLLSCAFCLQIETPWPPSPLFLQVCPLATMTHPRIATSLDTMTYLQYGIPHHPHSGARTAEEPR